MNHLVKTARTLFLRLARAAWLASAVTSLGFSAACEEPKVSIETEPNPTPNPTPTPVPANAERTEEPFDEPEPEAPANPTNAELDQMEERELEAACFDGSHAACDRLGH